MINNMNLTDLLDKIFSNVNYWLSFAEAKNAMNIAAVIALLSIILDVQAGNLLIGLSSVLLIISGVISFASFIPILHIKKNDQKDIKKENLLFYDDIKKYSEQEYLKKTKEYFDGKDGSKEKLNSFLSEEIVINSKITSRKYKMFKLAMILNILSLILLIIWIIQPYIIVWISSLCKACRV